MTRRVCEACGRPFPPSVPDYITAPAHRTIFDALARASHGLSGDQIAGALYRDDPNGGPLDTRNVVKQHIHNLRRVLMEHQAPWEIPNLKFQAARQRAGGRYRLVEVGQR